VSACLFLRNLLFLETTDSHIALIHPNHVPLLAVACNINVPVDLPTWIEVGAEGHSARADGLQKVCSFQFVTAYLSTTA
jgi:hypothetical protein